MGTLGQKLDYLDNTKSILKQKINNLGGSLTDQSTFRSYGDYLDELYNEMPKVTGEGTEITLTPTRKGKMQLDLKGNTSQASYVGKNLLNSTDISASVKNGVTYSIQNQKYYLSGTNEKTDGVWILTSLQVDIPLQIGKKYTLKVHGTIPQNIYIQLNGTDVNEVQYSLFTQISSNDSKTITITDRFVRTTFLFIGVRASATDVTGSFSIQLEEGTEATDYEPYVGGQPSPNPDYTQPIHIVTGNNTISIGNTNYPINLGSIELCNIGDYQDKFVKDNGVWKIPNKIVKIDSYNGETITTPYISTTGGFDIGATIYYVGNAEYTITDETLISQLDAIENAMSTTDTTTITQTNSDLPFIISASALKPFTTETSLTSLTDGE